MPSLGSLLLLALIFVTIGFMGGALVSLLWVEHGKEEEPPTESAEKASPPPLKGAAEVVSLWEESSSEQLILRLGSEAYRDSSALDDQQKLALEKVALRWISWLRGSSDQLTEPLPRVEYILKSETESRLVQVTAPPVPPAVSPPAKDPAEAPLPEPPTVAAAPPPPTVRKKPLRSKNPAVISEALLPAKEVPIIAPKSIVAQIDDVLQEMLLTMPDAPRAVRLTEDPRGGVIVWVGAEKFDGIDMVTDDSIQHLIRSAVAEWEKRTIH